MLIPMTHLRRRLMAARTMRILATTAATLAIAALPHQAMAWTTTSASGFLSQEPYQDTGTTVTITATLAASDQLQVFFQSETKSNVASHSLTVNGTQICSGVTACDGASYSAPSSGTYTMVMSGVATSGSYNAYLQCNGSCASPQTSKTSGGSTGGGSTGGGSTPTPTPTTSSQQAGQVVAATGASSASASGTAIGNAIGSRGGSGAPRVSTQGVFISTQGENSSANFWANLSGTSFSGVLDGGGAELTFGADWEIGAQTILGAALSYGKYDVTIGGTNYDSEALAVGPYISTALGETVTLDAYVLFARPDYRSGAATWKTDRVMGGLTAGMDYSLGQTQVTGYLGVSGFSEKLPATAPGGARTISQAMASIGAKFDFAPTQAIRPSLTVGADAIRLNDGATVTRSVSPRLGLGLDADIGPGVLSINVNGGEVFKDARAVSLGIKFSANF
ncbi:autotransporter domain-containing protein [Pseudooceanicola sp. MF1-13]|uniref:autotransporter domain-containing protein n=1 Tax=Pseudooceanicola sp. MF1-13 TaxID=3379095 RepID=UPI003891338D